MTLTHAPDTELDDLLWIMAQDSTGRIDDHNSKSSASELFQLLKTQYYLNPSGVNSFGDAIEECQCGIPCILGRYRTAAAVTPFPYTVSDWPLEVSEPLLRVHGPSLPAAALIGRVAKTGQKPRANL